MVAVRSRRWFNLGCVLILSLVMHWLKVENPLVWYDLSVDGVKMATAESDSLGIVVFEFELPPDFPVGTHVVSVNVTGTVPDLEVESGECEIVPATEGSDG